MKSWPVWIGMVVLALGCNSPGEVLQDFDGDGSLDANDCDPADELIFPGASDAYGDEVDSNCDGSDGIDSDGDGYPSNSDLAGEADLYDCNDEDAREYPDATDGFFIDWNCDGMLDPATTLAGAEVKFNGESEGNWAGFSVSSAGDVDKAQALLKPYKDSLANLAGWKR